MMSKNHIQFSLLIIVSLLVPVIYLFAFVHPLADDLVSMFQVGTEGLFSITKKTFLTWNGRYSGNLFNYFFAQFDSLLSYRISLLSLWLFFVFAFYLFVNAIMTSVKGVEKVLISLTGSLTLLSILPTTSEGIYWLTGAIYYELGMSLYLIYLALLVALFTKRYVVNQKVHWFLTTLILILTIGMNETQAVVTCFTSFVAFIYARKINLPNKTFILVILGVATLCLIAVVFSPGNENRISAYSNNKQLINALFMTGLQTVRFSGSFMLSFCGLFYFLLVAKYHQKLENSLSLFKPHMIILSMGVVIVLCVFLPYYATGSLGQHRTLNVAALAFIVCLTLVALKVGKELDIRLPRRNWRMVVYFALFFFVLGNGRIIFSDLHSGDAHQYDHEMTKRSILVKEEKTTEYLPLLSKQPKSIFVLEIKKDTNYWVDKAYLLKSD